MTVYTVVPCFNEAHRLEVSAFAPFWQQPTGHVLFVDDGSTDATSTLIETGKREHGSRIELLRLERNMGKAEAVRLGLLRALEKGAAVVGYFDADLATPPADMLGLITALERQPELEAVLGSRVMLLGRDIRRHALRHYVGRVFATAASVCLDLGVYDTQCGAKVFRASERLQICLQEPFVSRWAFDVELLGRLLRAGVLPTAIAEVPVSTWHDQPGSKVTLASGVRAVLDMARIGWDLRVRDPLRIRSKSSLR